MEYLKRRRPIVFINKPPLFYSLFIIIFFFFFSFFTFFCITSSKATCPDNNRSLSANAHTYFQQSIEKPIIVEYKVGPREVHLGLARRLLGGPGSYPPRCMLKCGKCLPCRPVHVSVPPGTSQTAEYYPEAWRCKCGKKLYIP